MTLFELQEVAHANNPSMQVSIARGSSRLGGYLRIQNESYLRKANKQTDRTNDPWKFHVSCHESEIARFATTQTIALRENPVSLMVFFIFN